MLKIDPEAVMEAVRNCPSGALAYTVGGVKHAEHDAEPGIVVSRNGPYYVAGGVSLEGRPAGVGASSGHYALCRCGASQNKPFCDGAHWGIEFADEKN